MKTGCCVRAFFACVSLFATPSWAQDSPRAEAPAALRSYRIRAGENLWDISRRLLGAPEKYKLFITLNPWITQPDQIPPGATLLYDRRWKKFTREEVLQARIAWLRSPLAGQAAAVASGTAEPARVPQKAAEALALVVSHGTRLLEVTPEIKEVKVEAAPVAFAETPKLEAAVSVREAIKEAVAPAPGAEGRAPAALPSAAEQKKSAEERVEIVKKAVEANPEDKKLKSYLVTAQAVAGNEGGAQSTIEEMIQGNPEDPKVHADAAGFFATAAGGHNFDRALAEIRRAEELDSSNNSYLIQELSIARKAGYKDQARDVAKRLTSRMPAFAGHPVVRQVLDER